MFRIKRKSGMDLNSFKVARDLYRSLDWLNSTHDGAIEQLLFDECPSQKHRDLVIDLLQRLKFLTTNDFRRQISEFAKTLVESENLSPNDTIISAMAIGSEPDGSESILQTLKHDFAKLGVTGITLSNRATSCHEFSKKSEYKLNKIILIDDFLGSGKTALGRISEIMRQFKGKPITPKIMVRTIFASTAGINKLAEAGVDFKYIHELKRSISDYYPPDVVPQNISTMLDIESCLSRVDGDHKMDECSMGYGGTEMLIAIEDTNIPNSVFPIFWWPKAKDDQSRRTLFFRATR